MKKVILRGPVLTRSGYGVHTRQIFKYLLTRNDIDLKVEPLHWGITPWYTSRKELDGLIGDILDRCNVQEKEDFDVSIQVQLPNEWDTQKASYNIGVTAGVETDAARSDWASFHCEKMDKVIVPSQFAKDSLLKNTKTNTEIKVVPESYFNELSEDPKEVLPIDMSTDFNFLTVGVLTGLSPETDRKNLFFLLKWFSETFRGNNKVGLVVKTNRGRQTTIDRKATANLLTQVLKEIGHVSGSPSIYFLHGDMSREEMNLLYKHPKIKALLSTTRGEGFGLPLLEAAAADLPVLATNWSAHTEFLNLGKWISFDYSLTEVHENKIDKQIFVKVSKWAEVHEKDFKAKLIKFYNRPEKPKEWAIELGSKIRKEYSFESICSHYENALKGVLD